MWHSRFPSSTRRLLVVALFAGGCEGCGDDECGPMGADPEGLVAASADVVLTYGNLTALAGNDCPQIEPPPPEGVVSVSVEGNQVGGPGLITFCIVRPDLLEDGKRTIGTSLSMADIRIFDLTGAYNNCTFTLDSTRPPSGFAGALGVCGNAVDPAGFGIDFDAAVSLRRNCGGTLDTVAVTLTGLAAVALRPE